MRARCGRRQRARETEEIGLLRQVAQRRARLDETLAGVGLDGSGGNLQQRGFAAAVAPDQAQAVAFGNRKLRSLQQRRGAEAEVDIA